MKEYSLFVMNYRFMEIIQDIKAISHAINEHPVALLTEHTKKLLQRDNTVYTPILSQRHRNAAAVYAAILHKLYGIELGPCFHCGITKTILWRNGPPGKPVLCNSCGSRWRVKRTLDGYIPRHGNREIPSYHLPSEMKPARDDQKLEVGIEVSGQDCSSACLDEEMNNISSLGSAGSSSDNCMQMEEINGEADKDPLWNPDAVPRRKRSELRQRILSPVERLQRQLHHTLQEPGFENICGDDESILIYARNKHIPPNEIGLGASLLVSPTTTTEHSASLYPMVENSDL